MLCSSEQESLFSFLLDCFLVPVSMCRTILRPFGELSTEVFTNDNTKRQIDKPVILTITASVRDDAQ